MKFNYRNSLQTINLHLNKIGYRMTFIMQNGKGCFMLSEILESGRMYRCCGHYYTASQAAEIATELTEKGV